MRVVEELLAHVLCDMREEVRGEGRRLYVDEPHAHGRAPFIVERPRPPSAGLSGEQNMLQGSCKYSMAVGNLIAETSNTSKQQRMNLTRFRIFLLYFM